MAEGDKSSGVALEMDLSSLQLFGGSSYLAITSLDSQRVCEYGNLNSHCSTCAGIVFISSVGFSRVVNILFRVFGVAMLA